MSKRDSWKSIEIGQSAAKLRIGERSETSPRGRTPRNRGKREAYGFIYLLIDPYSTGETKEYASITHAALVNNVHIGNISRCANGTRSTTGGFV